MILNRKRRVLSSCLATKYAELTAQLRDNTFFASWRNAILSAKKRHLETGVKAGLVTYSAVQRRNALPRVSFDRSTYNLSLFYSPHNMHFTTLLFASIAAAACYIGRSEARGIGECQQYNPIRMTTQKTLVWRGYKNLKRQLGSSNFAKDTFSFQSNPGSFVLDVKNAPTWKNVFIIVPKKGKGDDRLYWVNNFSSCRAFWDMKQEDIGAVAIIHVAN